MKNSFVLYASYYDIIKDLDNEKLGLLFRAIYEYNINDEEIDLPGDVKMAFKFIKNRMDVDAEKWEETKEKRSLAGKKGMEKRWKKSEENRITNDNHVINVITEDNKNNIVKQDITKITVNDNVNVNVNDNVNNNNVINKKKINKKKKFGNFNRITLTDDEYERLCSEFGKEFINTQIKLLDEYVESNNNKNKYSNFNLVLRKSIRENWFKGKEVKQEKLPDWFDKQITTEELSEDVEKEFDELMKDFS